MLKSETGNSLARLVAGADVAGRRSTIAQGQGHTQSHTHTHTQVDVIQRRAALWTVSCNVGFV